MNATPVEGYLLVASHDALQHLSTSWVSSPPSGLQLYSLLPGTVFCNTKVVDFYPVPRPAQLERCPPTGILTDSKIIVCQWARNYAWPTDLYGSILQQIGRLVNSLRTLFGVFLGS